MAEIMFDGVAGVYLQGVKALEVCTPFHEDYMDYYVGEGSSSIMVRDYRPQVRTAAMRALQGNGMEAFANLFSTDADISVSGDENHLEIALSAPAGELQNKTLWLGVIDNGKMSIHPTDWEVFKPISNSRIAFAALTRE